MKIDDWLQDLKMSRQTYFRLVLVSIVVFGVVVPMILTFLLAPILGYPMIYILYVLPIFMIVVVLLLPAIYSSKRKLSVDSNMPMFVTTMAALSTSDMPFDKVFYVLAEKKEFG